MIETHATNYSSSEELNGKESSNNIRVQIRGTCGFTYDLELPNQNLFSELQLREAEISKRHFDFDKDQGDKCTEPLQLHFPNNPELENNEFLKRGLPQLLD